MVNLIKMLYYYYFILCQAYRVAPQDLVIIYNLAYVLKEIAIDVFKNEKYNLKDVLKSVHELELAYKYNLFLKCINYYYYRLIFFRYFQNLSVQDDLCMKYDVHMALVEANHCKDLLSQSKYYVAQARKTDRDERELRQKRNEELEAFKIKRSIKKKNESQVSLITDYEEEILLKCQQLKEKTKNALIIKPKEPKSKKKHKYCESNYGGSVTSEANRNINPGPSKSNKSKTRYYIHWFLIYYLT